MARSTPVLADPEVTKRMNELGGPPLATKPEVFGQTIKDETEKWAKVVTGAGLKKSVDQAVTEVVTAARSIPGCRQAQTCSRNRSFTAREPT